MNGSATTLSADPITINYGLHDQLTYTLRGEIGSEIADVITSGWFRELLHSDDTEGKKLLGAAMINLEEARRRALELPETPHCWRCGDTYHPDSSPNLMLCGPCDTEEYEASQK